MNYDRKGRIYVRPPRLGFTQATSAEADQKSGLRADGDEASRGAVKRRLPQRERRGRCLRHPAGGVGEDSAAAGEGWPVVVAERHQWRMNACAEGTPQSGLWGA